MKMLRQTVTACLLLGLAVASQAMQADRAAAAPTGSAVDAAAVGLEAFQGGGKSLAEAVEQVRRQYGGRIISAETQVSGGREVHVIKVLTDDGKVKTVRVQGRKL